MTTRLLILDFDGVCTLSSSEMRLARIDPADLAGVVRPGASDVVADAQERGIVVVVLSNELDAGWIERVPLLQSVDRVVVCADNGIFKPDRRAFQRCLLLTGATAENTMMVDDQADSVAVAASLGMEAVQFDAATPDPWVSTRAWIQHQSGA